MPAPVLTVSEMRAWEDRTWAAGIAQESVIQRAGRAVAEVARRWTREGSPVLVLAGTGHNGDDALVAAGYLAGRMVQAFRLETDESFETALGWLERWRGRSDALVIDGLFGIGLNRPLTGAWARLVDAVNASRIPVLAVDVPSGVSADTGEVLGDSAVVADVTVMLGAPKVGLLREGVARHVGRLLLAADIGLASGSVASATAMEWITPDDFAGWPPARPWSAHKGNFGHVAILAGSLGYHGAAVLAAQGAQRARPGLITVFTDERCYVPVGSQLRSAMVRPWKGEALEDSAYTAIVAGPGLASKGLPASVRFEIVRLWKTARCPMVVDASALDLLPRGEEGRPGPGPRIITPHPGEAGRLLGCPAGEVQDDRPNAVRRLSELWPGAGVWVVLKGRLSWIGRETGGLAVNPSGNPGLAQGGTGDVLAGFLGGLLAQPDWGNDVGRILRFGTWRHGAAADRLEETSPNWTTEDLVGALSVR